MPDSIPKLSFDQVMDRLLIAHDGYRKTYLAMYSSWYGGIITDQALMMVPIDDHLVHRGDGVFEAFKCVGGNLYAMERHLDRLERSAAATALALPMERFRIVHAVRETVREGAGPDCLVRLFVSRGPGGFTTNPYECPASQLYIVVTSFKRPSEEKYEKGVVALTSRIPMTKGRMAAIKSCNYMPNVLMKKEAVDAGVDYTISIDQQGFLGEGSTENIGIVTKNGEFLIPRFDSVLQGTTVARMVELAAPLVAAGELKCVSEEDITPERARDAAEMLVFGTTFDVLPIVNFDGLRIGGGSPGPHYRRFLDLLREDMKSCREMLTPVWTDMGAGGCKAS